MMEHTNAAKLTTRDMTKMAICVALLCVAAYISFPLPFTVAMVTALTIVMNLSAFILTPKQTFTVIVVYLLLGAVGVPVFPGGAAGLGKLFGPTGGFYFAYLLAYPLVSMAKGKENSLKRYILVAVVIGMPITYIGGLISMYLIMQVDLWSALVMAVFPFIPGDIFKAAAAAFLGVKTNKVFQLRG
jgi:biotin transport system substrate-specific component